MRAVWANDMKPAPFDYVAPSSLEEAVRALAAANGDGKIMAGGQSLMPLLNFRMARPSVVVDLRKIFGTVVHRRPRFNHRDRRLDPPCRRRTFRHRCGEAPGDGGGHAACRPPCHPQPRHDRRKHRARGSRRRASDARRFLRRDDQGAGAERPPRHFGGTLFCAALITSLEPDEIVYEIEYPILSSHNGWGFEEVARRFGDFALGCVAVSLERLRWTDPRRPRRGHGRRRDAASSSRSRDMLRDAPGENAVFKRFSEAVRSRGISAERYSRLVGLSAGTDRIAG